MSKTPQTSPMLVSPCGRLALVYAANRAAPSRPTGRFSVQRCGLIIGSVSLVTTPAGETSIGYEIAHDHRRLGYGGSAVGTVIAAARAWGLTSFHAQCRSDNVASRRLLERAGFKLVSSVPFAHAGAKGTGSFLRLAYSAARSGPAAHCPVESVLAS